jgi:hypothetical protein
MDRPAQNTAGRVNLSDGYLNRRDLRHSVCREVACHGGYLTDPDRFRRERRRGK